MDVAKVRGIAASPTVSGWAEKIQSGDLDDRKDAVEQLSNAGPDDVAVVAPALIGALKDREVSVRNEAVLALGHYLAAALKSQGSAVADPSRAAASGLIEVIKNDGDNSVRASAAFAMASLYRAMRDAGIKPDQSRVDDPIDPKNMARAFSTVIEHDPATRLAMLGTYQSLGPIGEPAPLRSWPRSKIHHRRSGPRHCRRYLSSPAARIRQSRCS